MENQHKQTTRKPEKLIALIPQYLSITQLSKITGYHINTIRNHIYDGSLKAVQPTPRAKYIIKVEDAENKYSINLSN
ncbi:hypothetical protein JCM19296_36 [Nonlabens ulvanivorans]|uniref:Helix-turn-helix domain-containing protein n=1 Tax=Nonlabens ulvanivorans TaxID=906888 RepID=A0A081D6B2_NONUL|nr:hypothetical protein [Nonlabens ulvanivorans]GAK74458.1 hypothetical protein JCM19296_36 [Nonlabens ulvanivorans]